MGTVVKQITWWNSSEFNKLTMVGIIVAFNKTALTLRRKRGSVGAMDQWLC